MRRPFGLLIAFTLMACVDVPPSTGLRPSDAAPSDARPTDGAPVDSRPAADRAPPAPDPCAACPASTVCVEGRCVDCEPVSHRGCDADSTRPLCDPESLTCTGCTDDDSCGGRYCLSSGRCAECRPDGNLGCDAPERPICDVWGVCQPCAVDAECVDAGRAPICDPEAGICRICVDGIGRGCDPTGARPVCEDNSCRACTGRDECGPGLLCLMGRCEGCNPADNSGCDPTGDQPICQGGFCVPCVQDGQCLDEQRGECVGGRCRACDPETHAGCDPASDRPLCDGGRCVGCGEVQRACAERDPARPLCLENGQCAGCDPADGAGCDDPAAPACDGDSLTCVGCRGAADCPGAYCDPTANGRCVPCVAGTSTGCDPASDTPTCAAGTWTCEACSGASCVGNPLGPVCERGGSCGCEDDDECVGPLGLHCHGAGTCGCHTDDQCPDGRRCRDEDVCVPR